MTSSSPSTKADVVVVGSGLAGLVATAELADAGRRVILVDQEPEASFGGQAFWSLGGLMFVDSPEQRRCRVKDSVELALQDWMGTAGFDREEDRWPRAWAEAYVHFAAGEKRSWLHQQGMRWLPNPGWPERGGYHADGHGNSVPRFHITWGTGPGVVAPFERRVREAVARGLVQLRFRHRVTGLTVTDGAVTGVTGEVLAPSSVGRGEESSRDVVGDFALEADAVVVTTGGIGGNHELVRRNWPARLGQAPERMLSGVPAHVDGLMLGVAREAGASEINGDRMWHYVEGIHNWDPIWPRHAIRIIPGPSSMWFDATGRRLPGPLYPGFDTLGTLDHIMRTGHDYTWFVLTQKIIEKEFALSGSEQNPDTTSKSLRAVFKERLASGPPSPVQAFMDKGEDFIVERDLRTLVARMNALTGEDLLDHDELERQIVARDREITNAYAKDGQVTAIHGARQYFADKITRVAAPHRILDPEAGPLVAVRLSILTRKSLGGLETDLDARVLRPDGEPLPGLYAAGEVAGFGGGGMHGYRALEGTFLGGCLFSGRVAGRALAQALGSGRRQSGQMAPTTSSTDVPAGSRT
ncbi:FAD-binding dehydrogenase [Conexibacter sp. W3-3-2]|uniref:FAD-binding dehydrogenase n=1 Tax=Conexibacter sp. W3-3-2 TaxID=2675227 RepID=UPI00132206A6|nr:FAD-binding dehydrogenase [Conexibacter sp. W3-3-2]MTD46118.1 FAD-binding dehydrogenase [Conexibacter sp. W3-3-2]